jgi:hypothetical protein
VTPKAAMPSIFEREIKISYCCFSDSVSFVISKGVTVVGGVFAISEIYPGCCQNNFHIRYELEKKKKVNSFKQYV